MPVKNGKNTLDFWVFAEAESSIKMYCRDIRAYQNYTDAAGLAPMQPQTLRAWRDWLLRQTEPRYSSHTINRMLAAAWLAARPVASPYIFTAFANRGEVPQARPMTTQALWDAVQKYAARCGLAHIKPHDLRRFVGTVLAKRDIRQA